MWRQRRRNESKMSWRWRKHRDRQRTWSWRRAESWSVWRSRNEYSSVTLPRHGMTTWETMRRQLWRASRVWKRLIRMNLENWERTWKRTIWLATDQWTKWCWISRRRRKLSSQWRSITRQSWQGESGKNLRSETSRCSWKLTIDRSYQEKRKGWRASSRLHWLLYWRGFRETGMSSWDTGRSIHKGWFKETETWSMTSSRSKF